jgi:hypothetical protein
MKKMKLEKTTMATALFYLDSIYSKYELSTDHIDLLGICAIITAGKERNNWSAKVDVFELMVPMIMDMQRMTRHTLDYDMIKSCEGELLKMLDWDLIKTTHLHFTFMLMSEGIIFESDRKLNNQKFEEDDLRVINVHTEFICDQCQESKRLCLNLVFEFQKVIPTKLAAACVLAGRAAFGEKPLWGKSMQELTGYSFTDLKETFSMITNHFSDQFPQFKEVYDPKQKEKGKRERRFDLSDFQKSLNRTNELFEKKLKNSIPTTKKTRTHKQTIPLFRDNSIERHRRTRSQSAEERNERYGGEEQMYSEES